jgi:hypothetical protein
VAERVLSPELSESTRDQFLERSYLVRNYTAKNEGDLTALLKYTDIVSSAVAEVQKFGEISWRKGEARDHGAFAHAKIVRYPQGMIMLAAGRHVEENGSGFRKEYELHLPLKSDYMGVFTFDARRLPMATTTLIGPHTDEMIIFDTTDPLVPETPSAVTDALEMFLSDMAYARR